MFCIECGEAVRSQARFCVNCGAICEAPQIIGQAPLSDETKMPRVRTAPTRTTISARRILLTTVLCIGAFGWLFYRHYVSQPEYSLSKMTAALERHNLTEFEKYVDIQGVVGNLFDQAVDAATTQTFSKQSGDSMDRLGAAMGLGIANLFKPQAVNMISKQIEGFVQGGSFDVGQSDVLAPVNPEVLNALHVQGRLTTQKEGDIAYVAVPLRYGHSNSTITLDLKMTKRREGYWQISGGCATSQ